MLRKTQKEAELSHRQKLFGCFISGLFHYKSRNFYELLSPVSKGGANSKVCMFFLFTPTLCIAILILHSKTSRVSDIFLCDFMCSLVYVHGDLGLEIRV
jgi:hypothetical protein